MSDPANPKPLPPSAPAGRPLQQTVLLTEIPEASSLVTATDVPTLKPPQTNPPASARRTDSTGTAGGMGTSAATHLSSAALAALSQRYEILGDAGHGSMGDVYKARDRETGETVALKLLKPEIASDQAMMERFKNELLFARKITHKNVCRVHEFNRINGVAYTSMEFVEGESLRSVLNRFGALALRKGTDLALQICSGLKEAHAQGIVHRDLKPENVMIDSQGNVKIMDFGIARSMEAATRHTGSMVGTPAYMAPEQVSGKPVDFRTDIYSLGLMLYEMFTGTPAFTADNPVAVALKQMREPPTPPRKIEPMIPPPLERAILKCLDKEPALRFQTVADLENVLRAPGMAPGANYYGTPADAPPARKADPVVYSAVAPKEAPKTKSPLIYLVQAVILAAFCWGAWKSQEAWFAAENQPPPPGPALPKPPEAAYQKGASRYLPVSPTPPATPTVKPAPSESVNEPSDDRPAPDSPAATPKAAVPEIPPRTDPVPAKKPAPQGEAPPEVQQRADKAFGESAANAGMKYLWIGRFGREDKAQSTAKKLEDLGLPVAVIPKQGLAGKVFVVFAGPVGTKRVPSVIQWLEAQGFTNVHAVAPGAATQGAAAEP